MNNLNQNGFDEFIKRIMEKDKQILETLGSDFDEEGVPYWEKWGKLPIDKTMPNTIE